MSAATMAAPMHASVLAPRPSWATIRRHYLSTKEASVEIGISERGVRKAVERGRLDATVWQRRLYITRESARAWREEPGLRATAHRRTVGPGQRES